MDSHITSFPEEARDRIVEDTFVTSSLAASTERRILDGAEPRGVADTDGYSVVFKAGGAIARDRLDEIGALARSHSESAGFHLLGVFAELGDERPGVCRELLEFVEDWSIDAVFLDLTSPTPNAYIELAWLVRQLAGLDVEIHSLMHRRLGRADLDALIHLGLTAAAEMGADARAARPQPRFNRRRYRTDRTRSLPRSRAPIADYDRFVRWVNAVGPRAAATEVGEDPTPA
ncbi:MULTISPECIES: hypothetical protein [unclassified Methylobacterium]|uniref:hypothetical protein n=1 Tax=unclassified Methylobacterium TaxID=2615210 RepID=UPI00089F7A55|nr:MULTISPECIES: hypothetical protein [unclassified Methylobacterium]SEG42369.1 hypothetical protein SAMN04488144_1177 [Methylobacterium sp. 190mf]